MEQTVKISVSKENKWATVARACLTAANACNALNQTGKMRKFIDLHRWATENWESQLENGWM